MIQKCEDVTAEWLTEVLRANGVLQRGQVVAVECDTQTYNQGFVSNVASLAVRYSEDSTAAPARLFLKMSKPDVHPEVLSRGRHEIEFYQAVAHQDAALPLPRCFAAEYEDGSAASLLLIEDLSQTHFQRPLPIPPSNRHCELIVESLAHLHAAWWNHPLLGNGLGERLDEGQAAESRRRLENTLPAFCDYLGDALLPEQRRVYERILASPFWSRLVTRLSALQQVTLIHGDAHTGNVMLPHDVARHRAILVDWHLWDINVAAHDLAFLMALHWSPQRRRAVERPLVRHYYDTLVEYGVTNYSWDDLWTDYRESVIIMTLIPIGQFRRGSPPGVIWFGLQDSMAAFGDLDCEDLL